MAGIFLSYAREDRGCVEKLAQALEQAGHQVWWDRRIESGTEFTGEIEAALNASDVVLVAWSKDSIKSRWVRDEAAIGGDSGRLLPVLIDGAQPPLGFRQFHALDLTGWKGGKRDPRTAELLYAVERKLEGKGKGDPTSPVAESKPRFAMPKARPFWAIAAVVLLLVAAGTGYFLLRGDDKDRSLLVKPTIALLPFTTASSDAELRQLASQARDSLAHSFTKSGLPLRLMDSAPADGRSAVDFVMAGDLSRKGDTIVATVRLDEVEHRATVFSHRFEADPEDARHLPERIGAQMAGNLTWSFPLMVLDRRHPLDPSLLADFLRGSDFTAGLDNLQAYQNVKRIAAKAPELLSAQIAVAFDTAFVLPQLPRDERAQAIAEARRAAERAIALGPAYGDTYGTWCLLHSETRIAECEDRLRAAKRIDPDAPFLNTFLSHQMRNVGRFDESRDLANLAHSHDVYVPTKIAYLLKSIEYAGESQRARELYEEGAGWWPEFIPMFFRNRLYGLIERGDFEAAQRLEEELGAKNLPPDYQGSAALAAALKTGSIAAARKACPDTDAYMLNVRCMLALAMLGDQDGAYSIADKLYPRRVGRTPAETERIWLDEPDYASTEFITSRAAAAMRRDPRYLALAKRVGLLDYWRSGRAPDFCRTQPEPICGQLRKPG